MIREVISDIEEIFQLDERTRAVVAECYVTIAIVSLSLGYGLC